MMHQLQKRYEQAILELAEASVRLADLGYVASHGGNLSYRVDDNVILITPTKVAKRKIQFEDICIIDYAGNVLHCADGRKPTGETPMHTHVFKMRPDINAMVHAHPPWLTGYAIAHSDLLRLPLLPEPVLELGPVLSCTYEEPLTDKLAQVIDSVIMNTNAFLMENHGATVLSYEGIERALDLLEMAECMAQSVCFAKLLGDIHTIPEAELLNLDNVIKKRGMSFPGMAGFCNSLSEIFGKK